MFSPSWRKSRLFTRHPSTGILSFRASRIHANGRSFDLKPRKPLYLNRRLPTIGLSGYGILYPNRKPIRVTLRLRKIINIPLKRHNQSCFSPVSTGRDEACIDPFNRDQELPITLLTQRLTGTPFHRNGKFSSYAFSSIGRAYHTSTKVQIPLASALYSRLETLAHLEAALFQWHTRIEQGLKTSLKFRLYPALSFFFILPATQSLEKILRNDCKVISKLNINQYPILIKPHLNFC